MSETARGINTVCVVVVSSSDRCQLFHRDNRAKHVNPLTIEYKISLTKLWMIPYRIVIVNHCYKSKLMLII